MLLSLIFLLGGGLSKNESYELGCKSFCQMEKDAKKEGDRKKGKAFKIFKVKKVISL